MKKNLLAGLAVVVMMLGVDGMANANMLVNGSFESGPALGGASFVNLYAGSTVIPGWTIGAYAIDYCGPGTWNISDGLRNVDLDGSRGNPGNGSISQTIATAIGQQYSVNFDLSGNPAYYPLIKKVQVSAGADTQVFSYDIGSIMAPVLPLTLNYLPETFIFTATGASTTLSFTSLTYMQGITGYGPLIDNVVVDKFNQTTVPEPSTFLLLGAGLGGLALLRRIARK